MDRRILELRPEGEVTLYGSEVDFVERYSGRYPVKVLEASEEDFPDEMALDAVKSFRLYDFLLNIDPRLPTAVLLPDEFAR